MYHHATTIVINVKTNTFLTAKRKKGKNVVLTIVFTVKLQNKQLTNTTIKLDPPYKQLKHG